MPEPSSAARSRAFARCCGTPISDTTPGLAVMEFLDEVFETLTASLRRRGGEVLKFLGDGMLAIFPFDDATREQVCRQALDAAAEAMRVIDRLNATWREAGKAAVAVDLALHLGEVLYGNVGSVPTAGWRSACARLP